MKVKMKNSEFAAAEYCKRFAKGWDYYCVASEAFLAGMNYILQLAVIYYDDLDFFDTFNEKSEVEIPDGEHQLSVKTFNKWKAENEALSFKEAIKTFLPHFDFTDLRVEEKDGVISFQGTCKKSVD